MSTGPLRVGIDVRLAHWPGIGRYIDEIVSRMVADFPATEWVLFANAAGPATLRAYSDPGLPERLRSGNVRFVVCAAAPFSPAEPLLLGRLVRNERLQVMHSPYINIPWLPRQAPPLVVTLHDFRHPDLALQAGAPRTWAKRGYYELLTRLALARAARLVCVSHFLARQFLDFRPSLAPRLSVIHHAAGDAFRPLASGAAAAEVGARFGIQGRYLLFVGTLKPHKNLLAVVQALARPEVPADLQLVVAAAPDLRYPAVGAELARLGLASRVRMLGHVDKDRLPALYGAALATLLPSAYESFGLPLVESMACGTPVIAAPRAALPEVGADAAWYAEPEAEPLAQAICKALSDGPAQRQRRAASLAQAGRFSWRRAAAALHAEYLRAAAGAAP